MNVLGPVFAGCMKHGWVEEHGIALGERQLDMVLFEIVAKGRQMGCEIAGKIGLRVGQEFCGPGLQWHIAMGNRSLERQGGRNGMDMGRIV